MEAGKFLGFLLTKRGIEANPEKRATIVVMRSPSSVREVQQLTGRMIALSRFVSAEGDKGHPSQECKKAFLILKEYLANPSVLCKPQPSTLFRLYFAVTDWAISSVLVQEEDQVQKPIYFVSKVLHGPEVRYQALENAALAVPYQLHNKLSPKWTSPFRVKKALGNGAYRLDTLEGGSIPRAWDAVNLKVYFS